MSYRCETVSVEGFVQQLACNLVNKGYWFYVAGSIPRQKDPRAIDLKLVALYGLDLSKWARARRKAKGLANVAYLRFDRFFVLIATSGKHLLFERESFVRDIRRQPIHFHGYSIGCGKGSDGRYHASVKIHADEFAAIRAHLLDLAPQRSGESVRYELQTLRFVPFARVRRQLLRLCREVNESRRQAGLTTIDPKQLPLRRQIYKVFDAEPRPSSAHTTSSIAPEDLPEGLPVD
jgi:hypothetical protein